jgi:glycosyltransferase involved in cell wall biosynthesis
MRISVIIPTKNRAQHLRRVIQQILDQKYGDVEIIVCDGGSEDGTVELLKTYGSALRWISERDSGEYFARNKGLRMATGDLIKYMSDDDVMEPGAFAYAASWLIEHPETDILFNQTLWFYEEQDGSLTLYDSRPRTARSITLKNFVCGGAPYVASESVFFRRRVIDAIGVFDTNFLFADSEYWARAAAKGLTLSISDRFVVHHCKSRVSGVERRRITGVWEKWKLARKHGTLWNLAAVVLWKIPTGTLIPLSYRWLPQRSSLKLRKWIWQRRGWARQPQCQQQVDS